PGEAESLSAGAVDGLLMDRPVRQGGMGGFGLAAVQPGIAGACV
ncbi:hypothetical protein HMPREF1986_02129, partial [Oribacterium sp. oral taxon 078 str. F0263]